MSQKNIKLDFSIIKQQIPENPKFWSTKQLGTFFKIMNFQDIKNIICKKTKLL